LPFVDGNLILLVDLKQLSVAEDQPPLIAEGFYN
jgi:hypothetical protein